MSGMEKSDIRNITIANDVLTSAIRDQVRDEVDASVASHTAFTASPELLESIQALPDTEEKTELYHKYINILDEHQKTKNRVLSRVVENKIEKNNKIVDAEIEKDKARTEVFSNTKLLMFFMCFPIVISLIIIMFNGSYIFSSFVMLMWYGMVLALYFSQSDALNKLLKHAPNKGES